MNTDKADIAAWEEQAIVGFWLPNEIVDNDRIAIFSNGVIYLDRVDPQQRPSYVVTPHSDYNSDPVNRTSAEDQIGKYVTCQNKRDEGDDFYWACETEMTPIKEWSTFEGPVLIVHWVCTNCRQEEGRSYDVRPGYPPPSEEWVISAGSS